MKVMKIKNQFLNEETLKPYGFKKDFGKYGEFLWYIFRTPYHDVVIDKNTGEINLFCEDETNVNEVIYHLVVDGLIELVEWQ